uniref:Uncharacterized protein n=1 Tax=Rhizophora mucronata TaxID=61149 RepID=A0A2P2MM27_RHIMU
MCASRVAAWPTCCSAVGYLASASSLPHTEAQHFSCVLSGPTERFDANKREAIALQSFLSVCPIHEFFSNLWLSESPALSSTSVVSFVDSISMPVV